MAGFYLLYQYEKQRYKINVNQAMFEMKNETIEPDSHSKQLENITMEIDKSVWPHIRSAYQVDLIEKYEQDKLVVRVYITQEALNLSFVYH